MLRKYMTGALGLALLVGCSGEQGEPTAQGPSAEELVENVNEQPPVEDLGEARVSREVSELLARRAAELPVVATTTTRTGETFDWIPIESQTLDGAIATPPPPLAIDDGAGLSTALEAEPEMRGPAGTVPVLRPNLEKIQAPGSAQDFFSKYGTAGDPGFLGVADRASLSALERGNLKKPQTFLGLFPGDHLYAGSVRNATNYGFDAKINVWDPFVTQGTWPSGEFSLAQGAVQRGSGIQLQTVEVGWQEYPARYGDPFPHLFTYFTTNGYTSVGNNVGGYNRDFTGWVQVSATVAPGMRLTPTSTVGIANQREVAVSVWLSGGNWWVWYINQWIGYYPGALFATTGLRSVASAVAFQGEVVDETTFVATSTDMGSGAFASAGWGSAAYMRHLQYLTAVNGGSPVRYSPGSTLVSKPSCYTHAAQFSSNDPAFLSSFFYGGPGYNPNCQF